MPLYAFATQDAVSGQWIVGVIGDAVAHEVLRPTSFALMDETLAALGVRRVDAFGWEPWGGGLRTAVEFLI